MVPNKAQSSQRPRLDKQDRLFKRFYEPLVLLHVLDPNGEQRTRRHTVDVTDAPGMELCELRRTFLDQLAYVCDNTKGGDTVTAMALEAQPSGVVFWITANSQVSTRTKSFLRGVLDTLQGLPLCQTESEKDVIEAQVAQMCIDFGSRRIKAYQKLMQKPLQRCLASLRRSQESADEMLRRWLEKFRDFEGELSGLCHFAYQQRSSHCMKALQKHIGEGPEVMIDGESRRQAFLLTRHYIGRLGSHLRAAKVLIAAGSRMPGLLDSFTIRTRPSPKPPSVPPPTDHLTTLTGILGRMLPKGSGDTTRYQEALAAMDAMFNLQGRLIDVYQDKSFRPRVHAELNLLEYFYSEKLAFVDDDRFIGCSKPACYCCYHYICQHPGGFVRPPSHGVRYLNWRPPDLLDTAGRQEQNHQRDVLNKVIKQIRHDTLRHIERRGGRSQWRPDSTTGITYSENPSSVVHEIVSGQFKDASVTCLPKSNDSKSNDSKSNDSKSNASYISAGSSPDLCPVPEVKESLVEEVSLSHEGATDSDQDPDGGVLLT